MMRTPTTKQLVTALKVVAAAIGADEAIYCFEGRFAFQLDAGWWLLISPDHAERFRIDACLGDRILATMWNLAGDDVRLAELAAAAAEEAAALVA